jgi:S-adenosylmethionine decarboxylase
VGREWVRAYSPELDAAGGDSSDRGVTDERVKLRGFNNLTKVVSFNLYDFFVARTDRERETYVAEIDRAYDAARMSEIMRGIADIIDAEVLSISSRDYDPHGTSSLVLMSDLGHDANSAAGGHHDVGAHLSKSHLCAHTYPDFMDPRGICTFRVDIDVATCGTIVPLRALDYMFESFENDVVIIDYVVRGFTRDSEGRRVYIDHHVDSIQDFIAPEIRAEYLCEDMNMPQHNTWQTKMIVRELEASEYFPAELDPHSDENRSALEQVRGEMTGVFGSC